MYLMHVYLLHLLPLHVSKVLTAAGLSDTFCRTYCAYGTDSCIYPLLLSQELYNGEYCSTYVGKQDTQGRKHVPRAGGGQFLIPGRKTLPFKWKPKTAGTQPPPPPPGGRNVLKHVGKPSLLPGTCRHGGHRATHPREGTFPPPPRRSLTYWLAPHLLPETPKCRTAVWGRRGVFAQRRRVRWRSGEPVSRGAY